MLVALASLILFFLVVGMHAADVVDKEMSANNLRATSAAIKRPSRRPTRRPSFSPSKAAEYIAIGNILYQDANKCKTVQSFSVKPLSNCQGLTDKDSNVVTSYMKYTCDTNSASTVFYGASDSTCSATPTISVPVANYGVCPTSTTAVKTLCLSSTDISTLVKGVVYSEYSSQSACNAKTSSAVTQMFYGKDAFDMDGVHLYECKADGKGSFALVCNGADGIQQLKYSTKNCKGKSTQGQKKTFQQLYYNCLSKPNSVVYTRPTCYGPANMN